MRSFFTSLKRGANKMDHELKLTHRSSLLGKDLCQYNERTLIDDRTPFVTTSSTAQSRDIPAACTAQLEAIYARCAKAYPEFGLSPADFREAVSGAVKKYLMGFADGRGMLSADEISRFIAELQDLDLYLALACARGNENAWWQFDRQYRAFVERLARHLLGNRGDADEVVDSVYAELFGTRIVGGVRQSKFRTYTGRGTLRGWLRAVVSHAVVDFYRQRQTEIPLEKLESGEETAVRHPWRAETQRSEDSMLTNVVRERYRSVTMAALDQALATLDAHERLLLLYYHVEGLKLREIARIVEAPRSPIRRWFQRRSNRRAEGRSRRVHESTVMRWLEKAYRKVSDRFHAELGGKHGLNAAEIEICVSVATEDLGQRVSLNAGRARNPSFSEGQAEKCQIEGVS
jgi:RNA polymerase sigma-70 factor